MIFASAAQKSRKIVSSLRTNSIKYPGAELGVTVYKRRGKNTLTMRAHVFLEFEICSFDVADLQRVHGREDLRSASKRVR